MVSPHGIPTVDEIRRILETQPDKLTPRLAQEYALIVASNASRCRDELGVTEAQYAEYKCHLIEEGRNSSEAKIMADGSEVGQRLTKLTQHVRGLDEIIKVLKKAIQHFENEGKGVY